MEEALKDFALLLVFFFLYETKRRAEAFQSGETPQRAIFPHRVSECAKLGVQRKPNAPFAMDASLGR